MKILIDADACPKAAKEILFKAAERLNIEILVVANQYIRTPPIAQIKNVVVGEGYNVADDKIEELTDYNDLIITSDIPLADRVIKKGALALSPRGELFDEDNIGGRLATRDLLDEMRSMGMQTGGPTAYSQRDKNEFANTLNRTLTKLLK